ncbi:MAG: hypothetical protein KAR76_02625 [Methanosarcinales archaeon]|nr:hypothetical protein [Methanosarcinales archaeon]
MIDGISSLFDKVRNIKSKHHIDLLYIFLVISTFLFAVFIVILYGKFETTYRIIPLILFGVGGGFSSLLLLYLREKKDSATIKSDYWLGFTLFITLINLTNLIYLLDEILPILKISIPSILISIVFNFSLFIFVQKHDFFKSWRKKFKITLIIAIIILYCPFYLNALYIPYHVNGLYLYDGTNDIQDTSLELTNNLSNREEKVKALLNWQLDNLLNVWSKNFMLKKPYLIINRASNNSNLMMYYKHGVCGDFGLLLSKLATASGIENHRTYSPGENHEWVEIKINEQNDSWVNADASWRWSRHEYVYNDFEAYGNQSRVYYVDEFNNQIDVTEKYSSVGNLSVYVKSNEENITNFNVDIISQKAYSIFPKISRHPDTNGYFNYTLGTKRYTVVAKKSYCWGLISYIAVNDSVLIIENETNNVVLEPEKKYFRFR